MPEPSSEETSRIDRAEVERAAREEAERAAYEQAGRTAERPCLPDWTPPKVKKQPK